MSHLGGAITTLGGAIAVPDWVRERARGLLALADQGTPVADLTFDSLLAPDSDEGSDARTLRFAVPDGPSATVTARSGLAEVDVVIKLEPAATRLVCACYEDGETVASSTDVEGRAEFRAIKPGLMTFYVLTDEEPSSRRRTAWLRY